MNLGRKNIRDENHTLTPIKKLKYFLKEEEITKYETDKIIIIENF